MDDSDLAFRQHDHARCRDEALAGLRAAAHRRGLRLTATRLRVLELLLGEPHRALGAYELLDRLRAAGVRAQPPTVYRALDFLVGAGFVHRIEGLNAFVACGRPTHRNADDRADPDADGDTTRALDGAVGHAAAFLVCGRCRRVAEIAAEGVAEAVAGLAEARRFVVRRTVIEVEGDCPACRGVAG